MKVIFENPEKVIMVVHQSKTEMEQNLERLKAEGWSENVFVDIKGTPTNKEYIDAEDIPHILKTHPGIEIQMPGEKDQGGLPFVYLTEHRQFS